MRASLFQQILLPAIIFGMSHQTIAENEQTNRQNTESNQPQTNVVNDAAEQERLKKVRDIQKAWTSDGKRQLQRFPIYQAKYYDGDWNYISNAFINLAVAVSNLTQGKVRLTCDTIDIGADKLFSRKPNFIYFTGNKDFSFQESEIKNLKNYLYLGGSRVDRQRKSRTKYSF